MTRERCAQDSNGSSIWDSDLELDLQTPEGHGEVWGLDSAPLEAASRGRPSARGGAAASARRALGVPRDACEARVAVAERTLLQVNSDMAQARSRRLQPSGRNHASRFFAARPVSSQRALLAPQGNARALKRG